MTAIHRVSIQISRPIGPDDPGAAEWAFYVIEGGNVVVLTDRDGKALPREASRVRRRGEPEPDTRFERKLAPGEDAHRAARELLMQRYRAGKSGSDFHRPIRYPPARVV